MTKQSITTTQGGKGRFRYGVGLPYSISYDQKFNNIDSLDISQSNFNYLSSGKFQCRKIRTLVQPCSLVHTVTRPTDGYKWEYNYSYITPPHTFLQISNSLPLSNPESLYYGPIAYNRYKPGKSSVDGATAVGELLKDGIPDFTGFLRKVQFYQKLGAAYLQYEFGWKPFLNDIRKACRTTVLLHAQLKQLARDNGKPVRRRGNVHQIVNHSFYRKDNYTGDTVYPNLYYYHYYRRNYRYDLYTTRKWWFSGRFRYWAPDVGSSAWTERASRALYGARVTPSVLWNLLPWSWLIDWTSNVGAVIENLSTNAAENLCSDYAFLMYSDIQSSVVTSDTVFIDPYTGVKKPLFCSITRESEFKFRDRCSAFGFGLKLPDFSVRQLAILSALGLTKYNIR